MRMFDTIIMDIRCPVCHRKEKRNIQVKDFAKYLDVFRPGDDVSEWVEDDVLIGISDCNNKWCVDKGRKERYFDVGIQVKEGIITKHYNTFKD